MTPDQIKAARALLGWSQLQLSLRSDTSIHVVRTFEQTGRVMTVQRRPDLIDPRGGRLRRDTVSLWISGASADCYGVVPLAGRCAGRA